MFYQIFFLIALCASHLSFSMEPDQPAQNFEKEELWYAVAAGSLHDVKKLLAAGVSPNEPALCFNAPLFPAVMGGYFEICKELIAAGADVNATCGVKQNTPLMMVSPNVGADVCALLLKAGAHLHAINKSGMTPLHFACYTAHDENVGNLEACELFLQCGANFESLDDFGRQAINLARQRLNEPFESTEKLRKIIVLLSDPEKIREVILRDDNPRLEMKPWRKTSPNIFNALMGREMDRE